MKGKGLAAVLALLGPLAGCGPPPPTGPGSAKVSPDVYAALSGGAARVAVLVALRESDGTAGSQSTARTAAIADVQGSVLSELGAGEFQIFRRIILPNLLPAILSGVALAFARAIGEFGALVLITGNLPFKTEVASVYIFGRIESGDPRGAAAVSVVLLVISFLALFLIGLLRRQVTRHDEAA